MEENWLDEYQQSVYTISYTYDSLGRVLSASDDAATYEYEYDNLGRVIEETQTIDGLTSVIVFNSQYDARGSRTELSAAIGGTADFVNSYAYDSLGRLQTLMQQGTVGGNSVADKRVDLTYNAASQLNTIARYKDLDGGSGNLVASSIYAYDPLGRLTDLTHAHDATTLADYEWDWDAANRITQFRSWADRASGEDWAVTTYNNDDTGQLTDAVCTDWDETPGDESYDYDDNGNRTNAGYETGPGNRLLADGTFRYEYDAEGNLLYRYVDADSSETLNTNDTNVTEYAWDHRNRLTEVAHRAVFGGAVDWQVDYIYDAMNRRIRRTADADGAGEDDPTSEFYIYDRNDVVLDFLDADGPGETESPELTEKGSELFFSQKHCGRPASLDNRRE